VIGRPVKSSRAATTIEDIPQKFKDEPTINECVTQKGSIKSPILKHKAKLSEQETFKVYGLRNPGKKFQSLKMWQNDKFEVRLRESIHL
jgi:hypothetical protein